MIFGFLSSQSSEGINTFIEASGEETQDISKAIRFNSISDAKECKPDTEEKTGKSVGIAPLQSSINSNIGC